jgi:hypothetical protein
MALHCIAALRRAVVSSALRRWCPEREAIDAVWMSGN